MRLSSKGTGAFISSTDLAPEKNREVKDIIIYNYIKVLMKQARPQSIIN